MLLVCLARDELLDRRPGWGGGRAERDHDHARPARPRAGSQSWSPRCSARAARRRTSSPSRSPRARAATRCSPRRWSTGSSRRARPTPRRCRRPSTRCSPRGSTRCRAPSAACCRRASVVGQTFWEGSVDDAATRRSTSRRRSSRCRTRTWSSPTAGSRLAGEREYAFKHVLIRDVAYSTLPKAVRARSHAEVGGVHLRRAPPTAPRAWSRWSPSTTRRAAALGAAADLEPDELERDRGPGARGARGRRRRLARRSTPTARPRATTRRRSRSSGRARPGDVRADRREARRRRPAARARRPRGRAPGSSAWSTTAARRTWPGSATCTARSAPALWQKGDREGSIEHYQRGIDLLKDGPPCIELVRLYEEAASLYMHTGDNMLAIYASEKALRLAERLGEAAAASRAHGIFGRVFGRIGDSERARENLERSVELARETDPAEAVRALFALGYHLEVSEADYDGAPARPTARRSTSRCETGDLPSQVELHAALAQLAIYRGDWEAAERETDGLARRSPSARAWPASSASPTRCAGSCSGTRASSTSAVELLERAFEIAEQVGRSEVAFESLHWLATRAARPRRPRRRRPGARPRARPLRARRARRAVGRGDRRARRQPGALGQGRDRRARSPRRPPAWPSACATRSARPPSLEARGAAAADPAERARLLGEARERLGARSAARSTPSAARRCSPSALSRR